MVALYPTPAAAEQLASTTGETVESLHVTLLYYPECEPGMRDMMLAQVARATAYTDAVETRVTGTATFIPADGDPPPHVYLLDNVDSLTTLRDALRYGVDCCRPSTKYGFTPHITRSYGDDPGAPGDLPGLRFDHVSVVFGDGERHNFPLGSLYPAPTVAQSYREARAKLDGPESALEAARVDAQADGPFKKLVGTLKELFSPGGSVAEVAALKSFGDGSLNFYRDKATGRLRWVAFSSNAFEDREKEILSTDALERAVAYADVTGARGPLRLFHVKGADIGDTDFQAMEGRILVESGVLRDDDLGRAAEKYFLSTNTPLGVSVGFAYPVTQFDGQTYREVRIFERSVLPLGRAANPYTSFFTHGGQSMNDAKKSFLEEVLTPEIAARVVGAASVTSKALTEAGVAFKADKADDEKKDPEKDEEDEDKKNPFARFQKEFDERLKAIETKEPAAPGVTVEQLKELFTPLATTLLEVTDRLKAIEEAKVAEKATGETPAAASSVEVFRASMNKETLVPDNDRVKELLELTGSKDGEAAVNPVAPYVADLFSRAR